MTTRQPSALSRALSALKGWLRHSWLGRVALRWREWLLDGPDGKARRSFRPALAALERREVVNDAFSMLVRAPGQVAGHADIQRPVALVRHNVDPAAHGRC